MWKCGFWIPPFLSGEWIHRSTIMPSETRLSLQNWIASSLFSSRLSSFCKAMSKLYASWAFGFLRLLQRSRGFVYPKTQSVRVTVRRFQYRLYRPCGYSRSPHRSVHYIAFLLNDMPLLRLPIDLCFFLFFGRENGIELFSITSGICVKLLHKVIDFLSG